MKLLPIMLLFFMLINVTKQNPTKLKPGMYLAHLEVNSTENLPFTFEVLSSSLLKIHNAEEVILVDDIIYRKDSVYIRMPVFEGYIAAAFKNDGLEGMFIHESFDIKMPFKALYNHHQRFPVTKPATTNISGIWEVVFGIDGNDEPYFAKGIFSQNDQRVTGTFQTKTGDYRYLEGIVNGKELELSTFDGAHAYLFKAVLTDSTMQGRFYSGNTWSTAFKSKRNDQFELPDANSLTFLKEGYDKLKFSFPETDSTMVSLNDARFKDKVLIVQIMGTWCPNCLDESKYFSKFYNENTDKAIEFIGLAFEYAKTEAKAFEAIAALKKRVGINYPIVLAQYGTSNKQEAQEKLPMLNHVLSYPTSIFIDKKGNVRKIHTGFSGPATGQAYIDFKNEFENFVALLLAE